MLGAVGGLLAVYHCRVCVHHLCSHNYPLTLCVCVHLHATFKSLATAHCSSQIVFGWHKWGGNCFIHFLSLKLKVNWCLRSSFCVIPPMAMRKLLDWNYGWDIWEVQIIFFSSQNCSQICIADWKYLQQLPLFHTWCPPTILHFSLMLTPLAYILLLWLWQLFTKSKMWTNL